MTHDAAPAPGAPGWFPDPLGRYDYRWFNGDRWTTDVSANGARTIDRIAPPPTSAPTPPPAARPVAALGPTPPGWSVASPATPSGPSPGPSSTLAVLALVFGASSLALAWTPFLFVFAAGGAVAGFVLGVVALRRIRAGRARGRRKAIAGIALAPPALALCSVGAILTGITIREFEEFNDPGPYELTEDTCVLDGTFGRATGTMTNLDDEVRSYAFVVELRADGEVAATTRVEVADVAPGATATWRAGRLVGRATTLECRIPGVDGPAPFGIEP